MMAGCHLYEYARKPDEALTEPPAVVLPLVSRFDRASLPNLESCVRPFHLMDLSINFAKQFFLCLSHLLLCWYAMLTLYKAAE